MVPIEQIVPDPTQPRQEMAAERLTELAASIQEYGLLQPLLVRESGYMEDGRTRYMIVAGGRRYLAAQQAGLARLPVVVRDSEGATLRVMQLVENVQRQDLAPLEEARALKELTDTDGITAQAVADRLHISGQRVRDRLRLLGDQILADAVERQQISATAARDILTLPDQGVAPLRARVQAGETVQSADVAATRAHLAAEGVVNPRKKGGGRRVQPRAAHDHTTYDLGASGSRSGQDHTSHDTPRRTPPAARTAELVADHELEVVSLLRSGDGRAPRAEVVAALRRDLERLGQAEQ